MRDSNLTNISKKRTRTLISMRNGDISRGREGGIITGDLLEGDGQDLKAFSVLW